MSPPIPINIQTVSLTTLLSIFCGCLSNCANPASNSSPQNNSELSTTQTIPIKLTLIEPGTFKMGALATEFQSDSNEYPQHLVTLTKPYYIGVYEVTQGEYTEVMGFNPSTQKGDSRLPVETLSWFDAIAFCNALSIKNGLDSCYVITNIKMESEHITEATVVWEKEANGYRLPTEAEWEFACRAGTTTPFPFGTTIGSEKANYDGKVSYLNRDGVEHLHNDTKGIFRQVKLPVDSLAANSWGLYNIVGNVFEWVWDYYGQYPEAEQINPTGPSNGEYRVRRSGAFGSPGYHMRSALRHDVPPGLFLFHQGLRVVKNADK